jgi:hypothetical protein
MDHKQRRDRIQAYHHPHHRQNDDNKKRVIWIVVFLLLSVELPEVPTYICYLHAGTKTDTSDWFLYPGFHMKIVQYWYWKFSCERVAWIFRMIAFTKTAVQYSTTVFLAAFIILCYLIVDLFFFWFNYNTWVWVYEFLILFIYVTGRGLIRPYTPDRFARIKSIF